jgi:Transport and Golgi organisation 2
VCTVSWIHEDGGYQLFCNRDEKISRALALGPRVAARAGVRFVAPIDGDFGGAWIGVNEFGVSLCLLNGIPRLAGRVPAPLRSRGLLLLDLLSATCLAEINERVWRQDLSPFTPFTLAVLEPGLPAAVVEWNGEETAIVPYGDPYMPLVSSSFDQAGVLTSRREELARATGSVARLDSDVLHAFHKSHGDRPSAYSPCMHRADAETVSFTHVRVTESAVTLTYTPAAPCRRLPEERVTLPCCTSF